MKFLHKDADTCMAYLATIHALAKTLSSNEEAVPRVQFTDATYNTLIFEDQTISLEGIGKMLHDVVNEYNIFVRNELLGGIDPDHPSLKINYDGILFDRPQETADGWCFIEDLRNNYGRYENALVDLMLNHPRLRGRYHYRDGNRIIWKAGPCTTFLKACEFSRGRLVTASVGSSGSPGRAEELASLTLRNMKGLLRNVLILHGLPTFVGAYHKNSNQVRCTLTT